MQLLFLLYFIKFEMVSFDSIGVCHLGVVFDLWNSGLFYVSTGSVDFKLT